MNVLHKFSTAETRTAECPHPHNWFICSCGEEFGNWETPGQMRCYQCGEVCESTDNPAREEWFAQREAAE